MPVSDAGKLLAIIAHARAGALQRAWTLFTNAGLLDVNDDPAVLSLKGRLLKDEAGRSGGAERIRLYREAAQAYAGSASLRPATYPLINAAALSLLGGDPERARALAAEVAALLDSDPDEPETPYFAGATRAEALLLLDRGDEARAAFAEAIAIAPRAWEDHASTLRQFALVLEAQGRDASWLDAHRPPRSIHFGGHMSFDPKVMGREHLDEKIAAVLEEENIGFGFGALAAGADIIIAEALLARGAELHAVLPGGAESFASVSVDPLGKPWRERFDSLLERAETVRAVRPLGAPPDLVTIGLADEIAMGAAVMNARRLESEAVQLLVLDAPAEPDTAQCGWRQRIIIAPREPVPAGPPPPLAGAGHRRLGILAIGLGPDSAEQGVRLSAVAALLRQAPATAVPAYLATGQVLLAYEGAADAARAALAIAEAAPASAALGIGGHYGIADTFTDPFSGGERLAGEPAELAGATAASAPPGSVCVTDDFAAALAASNCPDICSEMIGELDARDGRAPILLYALKARSRPGKESEP
ncbi:MAG TPA: tetratricopeptide repeat-containing protein [Allosphingosinicella sp.]